MKTLTPGAKGTVSHSGQKLGFKRNHCSGYEVNKKSPLSNRHKYTIDTPLPPVDVHFMIWKR
jgi:hypothetical protein